MLRRRMLVCCIAVGICSPAMAIDLFWNPFAGKKSEPEKIAPADRQLPTNLPELTPLPDLPQPNLDASGPIDRFNNGTKQAFAKTKQALTPPKITPPKITPPKLTPPKLPTPSFSLKSPFRGKDEPKVKTQKKSGFGSWFKKEPEPPRPMTVSDFIGQPRPE